MMDGRIGAQCRRTLDEGGFDDRTLLPISAKFASAFYRDIPRRAGSARLSSRPRAYQMDPPNGGRRGRSSATCGRRMVMVKPALAYLDLVRRGASGQHSMSLSLRTTERRYA